MRRGSRYKDRTDWHKSPEMKPYKALLRSEILVLTGAGASVPLGMPAMDGFYRRLRPDLREWAEVIFNSFEEQNNDLEFLLGRIAYYEHLREDSQRDEHLNKNIVSTSALGVLVAKGKEVRENIFDTIVNSYGRLSPEAKEKAAELYRDLYYKLLPEDGTQPRVLPIFTTNYDLTFEGIRDLSKHFKLCNGMSGAGEYGVWERNSYREQEDYNFAIFRLHGCSHWVRDKGSRDGELAFQARPDRRDLANKEPVILYPLPDKDSRLEEEPFRTAYHHFELCLEAAKAIVIIGYSGRDKVVQRYLAEALKADPNKKFVIVSKGPTLRQELQDIIPQANIAAYIRGGIEGNTEQVWKAAKGRLELSLKDSIHTTDTPLGGQKQQSVEAKGRKD